MFVEENGDGPGVRLRRGFAEMTKARKFTQTYEVKVRLPGHASPSPTGKEFPTQEQAEAWIESAAGKKVVDAMLVKAKGRSK